MNGMIVIGTDTDAGKTAFSLHWLHAHNGMWEYWKPLETGDSDTETIRRLAPFSPIHEPLARYHDAVAPALAAKREGRVCPTASEILTRVPEAARPILIETFGSPLSPLNETELQVEWIRRLHLPSVLVTSSKVGAIGRTLQTFAALNTFGVRPVCVAMMGPRDEYAVDEIRKHADGIDVVSLPLPEEWSEAAFRSASKSGVSSSGAGEWWEAVPVRSVHGTDSSEARRKDEGSADLLAADRRHVWHPYTSLQPAVDPLPIVSASAEFLHLADGRTLIDAVSSWWTILHGHRHPQLMAALHEAAERLDHVLFAGATHAPAVRLAEVLLKSSPWPDGKVFYSDNGSTAVEVSLKMAYQYWCHRGEPQRTRFIGFEHAYHGDTFGAMAVGRDQLFFGTFEPLLFHATQIPLDPNRLDESLRKRSDDVAAVIVEPLVQGAGGMRMHSPQTLRELYEVARDHDILFIADEVMTGHRTGTRWAHQQAGIAPDLICAAKTLAGGILPLSVTLVSPRIIAAFDTAERRKTFFHGHSFTAHPIACAVAVVNERDVAGAGSFTRAQEIGTFFERELAVLREHPKVMDVRISGSIAAVELQEEGGYLARSSDEIRRAAIGQGVLLRPLGNVIYAMPPLECSSDSLQRIAETIRSSVLREPLA